MNNGRPMPKLVNLRSSNKKCVRHFQTNWYKKKKWFTGNAKLNKLFCWPCLVYNLGKIVWNEKGYDDLNSLHMSIRKHEHSQRHIRSFIDLKTFEKVCIDLQLDASKKLSIQHNNEKVKKTEPQYEDRLMQLYFWASKNYHFVVILNLKYPLIVEIIKNFCI